MPMNYINHIYQQIRLQPWCWQLMAPNRVKRDSLARVTLHRYKCSLGSTSWSLYHIMHIWALDGNNKQRAVLLSLNLWDVSPDHLKCWLSYVFITAARVLYRYFVSYRVLTDDLVAMLKWLETRTKLMSKVCYSCTRNDSLPFKLWFLRSKALAVLFGYCVCAICLLCMSSCLFPVVRDRAASPI